MKSYSRSRRLKQLLGMSVYLVLILSISLSSWQAQRSSPGGADVFVIVPSVIELTLLDGLFVDLGNSFNGEDLDTENVANMKVWTNASAGWTIYIWTEDSDLGPFRSFGEARKALNDFSWQSSHGERGELSKDRQVFARGIAHEEFFLNSNYFVDIKPSDAPGDYGVTLNYLVEISKP